MFRLHAAFIGLNAPAGNSGPVLHPRNTALLPNYPEVISRGTVQPGAAMTVKEMEPVRTTASALSVFSA
jgi:hypothetical protein